MALPREGAPIDFYVLVPSVDKTLTSGEAGERSWCRERICRRWADLSSIPGGRARRRSASRLPPAVPEARFSWHGWRRAIRQRLSVLQRLFGWEKPMPSTWADGRLSNVHKKGGDFPLGGSAACRDFPCPPGSTTPGEGRAKSVEEVKSSAVNERTHGSRRRPWQPDQQGQPSLH
jgi:hypothetical protein